MFDGTLNKTDATSCTVDCNYTKSSSKLTNTIIYLDLKWVWVKSSCIRLQDFSLSNPKNHILNDLAFPHQ